MDRIVETTKPPKRAHKRFFSKKIRKFIDKVDEIPKIEIGRGETLEVRQGV